jgi:PAS domain S-box-containing protein
MSLSHTPGPSDQVPPWTDDRPTLQKVIDGLDEYAVARLDVDGRVVSWNHAAEVFTGHRSDEVLGLDIRDLLPTSHGGRGQTGHALVVARSTGRYERRGWLERKNGSQVWARSVITPLLDETGSPTGFLAIMPRGESQQEKPETVRLALAQAVGGAAQEPEALIKLIPARTRVLLRADFAAVFTPEQGGETLVLRSADGWHASVGLEARVPVSSSAIGRVFSAGRTAPLHEVEVMLDRQELSLGSSRLAPAVLVPLTAAGRTVGLVMAGNWRRGRGFLKKDLELLRLFAGQVAIAIRQAQLRRERQRSAVVQERERLSRELHDGAIQSLYAVTLGLATTAMRADDPSIREQLAGMIHQIDSVILDLRNHIFELRSTVLLGRELDDALRRVAHDFELRSGVATRALMDDGVAEQLAGRAQEIVQIVMEALSNVGRHSRARTCVVRLARESGRVMVRVEDDGVGFDPRSTENAGEGLRNIRARVSRLDGECEVESAPDAGTRVKISLPDRGADSLSDGGDRPLS